MTKPLTAKVKLDIGPLHAKFRQMSTDMRRQSVERAVEAGALVVQTFGRLNAIAVLNRNPTGALANGITYEVRSLSDDEYEALIGPTAVYGAIHEFGGYIRARRAKALHWVDESGQHHFAQQVYIPARPYMTPALTEHEGEILEAVGSQIADDLRSYIEE